MVRKILGYAPTSFVVFFSAIQYGEEIELTILRSFFILSVIQNYNRTVKVFLNTIRKEVGRRGGGGFNPRGTIASSLWCTSGWFAYV